MKRKNRDTPGRRIAQAIIAEFKPKSVAEMQAALKEVFCPMFVAMLNGEMESYLGYESNSREEKETTNSRNGYFDKTIKTSMGETTIGVPHDRQASFELIILPKHKRDVSDIENKVLAMYARGMSQRDISATIDDIYGFKLSAEQISKITDYVLDEQENWQNRTLAPFYPFLFVDCLFVPIKSVITRRKNAPCTTFWAFGLTGARKFWYFRFKTARANTLGCRFSTN